MPVSITWDDPAETTLLMEIIPPWDWEAYMNAASLGQDMALTKPYTIHLIVDFSRMGSLPRGYLLNFQRAAQYIPSNGGLILMIGVMGILKLAGTMLQALVPQHTWRVRHVNSLAEARQQIADYTPRP